MAQSKASNSNPAVAPENTQASAFDSQTPVKTSEATAVKRRKHAPAPPLDVDPFVTISPVATATSQSTRTIRRKLKTGDFPPAIRMGGKLVWRLSVIRNWMAELEASQITESQN